MNWVDELVGQYREGRKELKIMGSALSDEPVNAHDKTQINCMTGSMEHAIKWMETGIEPGDRHGVNISNAYRYEDMDILPDITEELRKERKSFYLSPRQRKLLLHLFKTFSDRERQCYIMYEVEGMSMAKIADKVGVSKSAVQIYIRRAREKVELIAS